MLRLLALFLLLPMLLMYSACSKVVTIPAGDRHTPRPTKDSHQVSCAITFHRAVVVIHDDNSQCHGDDVSKPCDKLSLQLVLSQDGKDIWRSSVKPKTHEPAWAAAAPPMPLGKPGDSIEISLRDGHQNNQSPSYPIAQWSLDWSLEHASSGDMIIASQGRNVHAKLYISIACQDPPSPLR